MDFKLLMENWRKFSLQEKEIDRNVFLDRTAGPFQAIGDVFTGRAFEDKAQNIFVMAWEDFIPSAFRQVIPKVILDTGIIPGGHAGMAYVLEDGSLFYAEFGQYNKIGKGIVRQTMLGGPGTVKYNEDLHVSNWEVVSRLIRKSPLTKKMFRTGDATVGVITDGDTKRLHTWVSRQVGKQMQYGLLVKADIVDLPALAKKLGIKMSYKTRSYLESMVGGQHCGTWVADGLEAAGAGGLHMSFSKQFFQSPGAAVRAAVNNTDEFVTEIPA